MPNKNKHADPLFPKALLYPPALALKNLNSFSNYSPRSPPGSVQSSSEIPMSYLDAFRSDLTTIADVARHESLIYRHGFTPGDIRHNVKLALRTLPFDQLVEEFRITDIPPAHRDPPTNKVLHALLSERERKLKRRKICA